jgi:YD repeat-containing protein
LRKPRVDAVGRLASVRDAFGAEARFSYDSVGHRLGITYPDGNAVAYEYDQRGDLAGARDWLGGEYRVDHNLRGRPVALRQANGLETRAERDVLGRVLELRHTSGNGSSLAIFRYGYDALGNVINEDEHTYAYDALSRLIGVDQTRFTYDAVGNRLSVEQPDATPVRGRYDPANQLIEWGATPLEYDARGNLVRAGATRLTWDAAGTLRSIFAADGSKTRYEYDGLGNLRVEHAAEHDRRYTIDLAAPLPRVLSIVAEGETSDPRRRLAAAWEPQHFVYGPSRLAAVNGQPRYYVSDLRLGDVTLRPASIFAGYTKRYVEGIDEQAKALYIRARAAWGQADQMTPARSSSEQSRHPRTSFSVCQSSAMHARDCSTWPVATRSPSRIGSRTLVIATAAWPRR